MFHPLFFDLLPFSVSLLYCLTFELRFLITPSNQFSFLCIDLQNIVYPFVFFVSSFYCLSFDLRLLIALSTICRFPFSALQIIVCPFVLFDFVIELSALRYKGSDYTFKQSLAFCVVLFRSLCVILSFRHCTVCPSISASDYTFKFKTDFCGLAYKSKQTTLLFVL